MSNKKTLSALVTTVLALSISTVAARPIAKQAEQRLEVKPVESAPAPTDICKSVTSREEVAEALQAGIEPEQISEVYAACLPPAEPPNFNEDGEPVQNVISSKKSGWGNTKFEELTGCGYHPQRRELVCVVKLKQQSGYGGTPPYPANMGSFEWVKFCVFHFTHPIGWESVNISAVHVHDRPEIAMLPPYYYGVVIQANPRLHQALVNGQTLWARAALSWGALPSAQAWCPPGYWGNSKFLKIKLDP
ncbi:MAG TPA: hypothetical protein ENI48_04835 [Thioploca sp.]|nr:MAG: hypothetical protein B6247_29985 [Beggiatoa sp. 4572_84]HEC84552.1 hypothetical protein [Thioploca sp.]